jgi:hypothetical protein
MALSKADSFEQAGDLESTRLWRDIYECIVGMDDRVIQAAVMRTKGQ